MSLPFSTTNTIAITLLAIIIPLFILAVSLLGNAIERAKEEKTKTEEEQRKDTDAKISNIENKIGEARETGDTTELETELEKLKQSKKESEAQIKKIQKKYSLLEFKKSVLHPGGFFILAIILNELAQIYFKVSTVFWVGSILAIVKGSYRLCRCLILAQEVAVTSEEFQTKKLVEAVRSALDLHDKAKLAELELSFMGIDFPHKCKKDTEIKIMFRVLLKKGIVARKSIVYFFIPDGFEPIYPGESWRQPKEASLPNIRTISVELGDINVGIGTPGMIKIRTPKISGEYELIYHLCAEGYYGQREKVGIIVYE
ncbi:MAG: hypothetical protein HWN66_20535 [Candidatus Helarchaeota archaeon]|nr:hypothetical protein [Candidatus Helarchaeota archaeon]